MAASNPHFYGRRPKRVSDRIEGLHPNKEKHGSFIIVEPITGIPINQCARSQSNVITPKFSGFAHDIDIFSDMAIPTFWAEYVSLIEIEKSLTVESIIPITLSMNQSFHYSSTLTVSEGAHAGYHKFNHFHGSYCTNNLNNHHDFIFNRWPGLRS